MIVTVQNVTRRKQLLCLGGYGIFLMYGICSSFLFKKLLLPLTMVVSACLLARLVQEWISIRGIS